METRLTQQSVDCNCRAKGAIDLGMLISVFVKRLSSKTERELREINEAVLGADPTEEAPKSDRVSRGVPQLDEEVSLSRALFRSHK